MSDWLNCRIEDLNLDKYEEDIAWKFEEDRSEKGSHFIWWEKTVESLFLQRQLARGMKVAPLAGAIERLVGDAILENQNSYIIFEFKASKRTIPSERKKFRQSALTAYTEYLPYIQNFLATKVDNSALIGREPHMICYGFENKRSLEISSCDYWGRAAKPNPVKEADFIDYVFALSQVRRPPERGALAGGVLALTSAGTSFLDLNDVITAIRQGFERKHAKVVSAGYTI